MSYINSAIEHYNTIPGENQEVKPMENKNVDKLYKPKYTMHSQRKIQSGEGRLGTTGKALIALGSAGLMNSGPLSVPGIVGSSILAGLGHYLHSKHKKGSGNVQYGSGFPKTHGKFVHSKILQHIKKGLSHHGHIIGAVKSSHAVDALKQHAKKPLHIEHIFGKKWRPRGKQLLKLIQLNTTGSGFKDWAKKAGKSIKNFGGKAIKKLGQFAKGETKLKPSALLDYTASAVGVLGSLSAAIPGLDILTTPAALAVTGAMNATSAKLEQSGRGLGLSGKSGSGLNPAGKKCGSGKQYGGALLLSGSGKTKKRGTKREVWNGTAERTSSGLTKGDLVKNKRGKIVSKKQQEAGRRAFARNNLAQYQKDFSK
jgi:hypothetical protein